MACCSSAASRAAVPRLSSDAPAPKPLPRGPAGIALARRVTPSALVSCPRLPPALGPGKARRAGPGGPRPGAPRASLAGGRTSLGTFRAGQKRAEVTVPALALVVRTADVTPGGAAQDYSGLVDSAVAGGASMVVLESEDDQGSAAALFEAACALKTVLRGRAPLIVRERADIAAAAGADGVVLSDLGLPAVAARRMMEGMMQDAAVLPLVGREVSSADAAIKASAGDGADFIVLLPPQAEGARGAGGAESSNGGASGAVSEADRRWHTSVVEAIRGAAVTVPVILDDRARAASVARGAKGMMLDALGTSFKQALDSGASGIALHLADVGAALARGDGPKSAVSKIMGAAPAPPAPMPSPAAASAPTASPARGDSAVQFQDQAPSDLEDTAPAGTTKDLLPGVVPASAPTAEGTEWEGRTAPDALGEPASPAAAAAGPTEKSSSSLRPANGATQSIALPTRPAGPAEAPVAPALPGQPGEASPMEAEARQVQDSEVAMLNNFVALLRTASPQMAEISLLEDAIARLAEPFLVVIVGEFNSGKSSLINALLGEKFLKVGAVPTTNEITVLRHSSEAEKGGVGAKQGLGAAVDALLGAAAGAPVEQRHPDGHFLRFLPADLLKQLNIVDTPGTNVILERQQRLTEEFVPQADLVLFVLSADRPLTDSEVSFLRYIREWGKKVVFVLNKIDLLEQEEDAEVDAVYEFVCENVKRLLGVDAVTCFPLSSRLALSAKLPSATGASTEGSWELSRFGALEEFIRGFLEGSSATGAERLRLKLDTPLGVGTALAAACERQLADEKKAAEVDLAALQAVGPQMLQYYEAMRADSELQRSRITALVEEARSRADAVVDETLKWDNLDVLSQYLFSPPVAPNSELPILKSFQAQVVGNAFNDVRRALYEHFEWLQSNNRRQLDSYSNFAASRWPELAAELQARKGTGQLAPTSEADKQGSRQDVVPKATAINRSSSERGPSSAGEDGRESSEEEDYPELQTVAALEGFNTNAAALLLEEELRVAVTGIATGVGAAGVSATVLTSVLENPLEDMLALAVCSLGGAVGVLDLPGKREQVKKKIRRAANGLVKQLKLRLDQELEEALGRLQGDVDGVLLPYREAAEAELARVTALQAQLTEYAARMKKLRQRVQNIGS